MTRATVDVTTMPLTNSLVSFNLYIRIPKDVMNVAKLQKEIPRTLKLIAKDAKSFWDSEAAKQLKTSRKKYKESTSVQVLDNNTVMIVMEPFAGLIESAGGKKGRFDMKPGFMASTKTTRKFRIPRAFAATLPRAPVHVKTATKFLIIPMRWSQGGTKFRTVSDKSPIDSWIWKPKKNGKLDGGGVKLRDVVVHEMEEKIIPERMREMIEKVWGAS